MPDITGTIAKELAPLVPELRKLGVTRIGVRRPEPQDILLPNGFTAEVVATGFNSPVQCTFDDQGHCYVIESGYKTYLPPRIIKVDTETGNCETFFELPEDRWDKTGAMMGACWHQGYLYFSNTDTISRISREGVLEDIVKDLPHGDYQVSYPIPGPDGKLYFGVGSVTNAGVVGLDNYLLEWLQDNPDAHDVPARDVTLVGRNFTMRDVLAKTGKKVETGAFVPFGTETSEGQVIHGDSKCSGAILRCDADGKGLEVVAWGLRSPRIAFDQRGRLFVTEQGIDERGVRYVVDDPDDLYEIQEGAWYGWPDFAAGVRLDDPSWKGGKDREPLLQDHPTEEPPKPYVTFKPHAGAAGMDFCRDASFGFEGDAFVACFGDIAPIDTRLSVSTGFKVVRVDMRKREVKNFAVNKIAGAASGRELSGLERPSHCKFGPDGALYVVDWGKMDIASEIPGVRMPEATGVLWRIRRDGNPVGEQPPMPKVPGLRGVRWALLGPGIGVFAGALALVLLGVLLPRRGPDTI